MHTQFSYVYITRCGGQLAAVCWLLATNHRVVAIFRFHRRAIDRWWVVPNGGLVGGDGIYYDQFVRQCASRGAFGVQLSVRADRNIASVKCALALLCGRV